MHKILHVITNFAEVGGAEMMLSKLVLNQPNVEHHIISLMEVSDVYRDCMNQCGKVKALHWNLANTAKIIYELKSFIKKYSPDVIQGWMYHANVLTTLSLMGMKNKPKFFWGIHHSLSSIKEESKSTKIALITSKLLSKNPECIVYCAHSSQRQHEKFGFSNHKTVVIPNGVDIGKFSFHEQTHDDITVVGFAGRYHPAKGYQYLFETIGCLKDLPIIFKIAGKGATLQNSEIANFFERYQLDEHKVQLLGEVKDMPAFYQSIDLFLMTSITEGFPNVLVEAMASGIPCITTDVGDAKYIVDETGYVIAPKNSDKLQQTVKKYVNLTKEEKLKLKVQARKRILDNFELTNIAKKYLEVWES